MVDGVRALHERGVPTGLVSNSWGTRRYPRDLLAELFDGVVISGEEGFRKPDPRMYELGAQRIGAEPAACVFVDDLAFNLDPARELGMAVVHHTSAARRWRSSSGWWVAPPRCIARSAEGVPARPAGRPALAWSIGVAGEHYRPPCDFAARSRKATSGSSRGGRPRGRAARGRFPSVMRARRRYSRSAARSSSSAAHARVRSSPAKAISSERRASSRRPARAWKQASW